MSGANKTKIDHHFWKTLEKDLAEIEKVIIERPAHGVLTGCQALAHKKHGKKLSKHEAGSWGKLNLPQKFHTLIDNAMVELAGKYEKIYWDSRELMDFAKYVINELDIIGEF